MRGKFGLFVVLNMLCQELGLLVQVISTSLGIGQDQKLGQAQFGHGSHTHEIGGYYSCAISRVLRGGSGTFPNAYNGTIDPIGKPIESLHLGGDSFARPHKLRRPPMKGDRKCS